MKLLGIVAALILSCTPVAFADDAGTAPQDAAVLITESTIAPVAPAGSGSAVVAVTVDDASGSAASSDGAVDTLPEAITAYQDLKAKYLAIKGATTKDERIFLWAVLFSVVLKYAIDGVNALGKWKYTKAMALVAAGLAIPIALLAKFIADRSWWEAIVLAGSGPGAVFVHELFAFVKKSKAPTAPPATA